MPWGSALHPTLLHRDSSQLGGSVTEEGMLSVGEDLLVMLQFLHKQMGQWYPSVTPLILSYKAITALLCPFCSIASSYHSGTDTSPSLRAALMH